MLPRRLGTVPSARFPWLWKILPAVLLASGCSAIQIETRSIPGLASAQLETYAWDPTLVPVDEVDGQVRAIVEERMWELGVLPTSVESADFLVSYSATIRTRRSMTHHEDDPFVDVEEFEVGTLGLQFRDRESGGFLWGGRGEGTLRLSGLSFDEFGDDLYDTDETRNWRVEEKLGAMFERLREDLRGTGRVAFYIDGDDEDLEILDDP